MDKRQIMDKVTAKTLRAFKQFENTCTIEDFFKKSEAKIRKLVLKYVEQRSNSAENPVVVT